jgi:Protein of unknown function (DUF3500)
VTRATPSVFLLLVILSGSAGGTPSGDGLAIAANELLDSLDAGQRSQVLYAFEADERFDWHFIPKNERKGLPLKDMTAEQSVLAHELLRLALSTSGYTKTREIMELEDVLLDIELAAGRDNARQVRDSLKYYVTLFGQPQAEGNWALSFEGHHLSLNFTIVDGEVVASSPAFMGANPHKVTEGEHAGLRVLGAEEDKARALLAALDDRQRDRAIVTVHAPTDIFSGAEARVPSMKAEGLPASAMNAEQVALLHALIDEYANNVAGDAAQERRGQVEAAGDDIYFAWMGSATPGEPYYYCIQAPTFLIEFDNIQNDANHSHTVWRDFDGDFGRDLIGEHRAAYVH